MSSGTAGVRMQEWKKGSYVLSFLKGDTGSRTAYHIPHATKPTRANIGTLGWIRVDDTVSPNPHPNFDTRLLSRTLPQTLTTHLLLLSSHNRMKVGEVRNGSEIEAGVRKARSLAWKQRRRALQRRK